MSSRPRDGLVRTFGFRLALWYFGLFVAGTALVLLLAYMLLSWSLQQRDREIVETTLNRYAAAFQRGGLRGLDASIAADRAAGRYEPLLVRVVTPGGAAVRFSMPADWGRFDLSQLSDPALLADGWGEVSSPGSDERLAVASRMVGGSTLLQVGRSTLLHDELLARFRGVAVVLFGAVVLVAVIGGRALAWSALEPLRRLTATIGSILERGTTAARVPVAERAVQDEIDELGVLVNRMLDRIDALIGGMRGSLDHVAHDLRTPVTRLRATAETALRSAATVEDCREALADCVEESERVMAMLDAMMDLAEAETGTMALRVEAVDVAAIARDAADLYGDVAEQKGVRLTASLPERLEMHGDRNRLAQAIANLLDNAVKYTPSGGEVTLAAGATPEGVNVEVVDTGIGIPEQDLPRIWERLYRGDRSRSERGLGLGLSLVKAIVEAHGGSVEVESAPGHGSRFRLRLPPRPPATNMTHM
jgi:signal transduction histidine kinase